MTAILTYKFRVKDATTAKHLNRMAGTANFVWNYCNETSALAWGRDRKWLTWVDMIRLVTGSSKELDMLAHSINRIAIEHAEKRSQHKRSKLRWRSSKKSLGWVPFPGEGVKVDGDRFRYNGRWYRFWRSREIQGKVKAGCFVQDARRRWYVCFQCEAPIAEPTTSENKVGIDLGFKDQVVCSDGQKFSRENQTRKHAQRLATAQRAKNKKQVANVHAKIANARRDWANKVSTQLVKSNSMIVVGNVSSKAMIAKGKGFAKSALDASWYQFKAMLLYKASRHGVAFREINEAWSTVTCSTCSERSGPSGLRALGVREWGCTGCGTLHDRDVNAARNILQFALSG